MVVLRIDSGLIEVVLSTVNSVHSVHCNVIGDYKECKSPSQAQATQHRYDQL